MSKTIDEVLPDEPREKQEGWRLHVYQEPGDLMWLSEEQVLPECLDDPQARRVKKSFRIQLSIRDMRWLREQLDRAIASVDAEEAAHANRG